MSRDTEQYTSGSDEQPLPIRVKVVDGIEIEENTVEFTLPILDPETSLRNNRESLDLTALRQKLADANGGKEYWRSLEDLAGTSQFQELVDREFPEGSTEWQDPVSRRGFLKLMGASLALAGIGACTRQPEEKIVPYVKQPEQFVPGRPLFFATAMPRMGYAQGMLVESHLGRPTKIEGNPEHPASLGAADAIGQASVLGLYDPDRSQTVLRRGEISNWESFAAMLTGEINAWKGNGGTGLHILTETITSPTLAAQMQALQAAYPNARWHQYDPVGRDNVRDGARLAFGEDVNTIYNFDRADVVVSLDANFLMEMPGSVRYARHFIDQRRVSSGKGTMNRLYVLETTPTITGATADHRRSARPAAVESFAWELARALGAAPAGGAASTDPWIAPLVKELQGARGRGIIIAGDQQPPAVHALAHAMNQALGNVGATVVYTDPVETNPSLNHNASIAQLARDIDAGQVNTLIVLGGNPVFNAPADLAFAQRYQKVRNRIHLGLYVDETAYLSQWHIPESHFLESWSDARAYDGTVSIIQPLIAPMYTSRSAHEVVAALLGQSGTSTHDLVQGYWKGNASSSSTAAAAPQSGTTPNGSAPVVPASAPAASGARIQGNFETGWQKALFDGVIANSAAATRTVSLRADWASGVPAPAAPASNNAIDLIFRPDPTIWDGRYINNGWLQELPKPLTKLTWDNALLIAPAYAERMDLATGDIVEISYKGRSLRIPVWIMPGHADGAGTLYFGYGRERTGRVGTGTGFNAYAIRTSDAPWFGLGATIQKTGDTYLLVTTQEHQSMEDRELVRVATLEEYKKKPDFAIPPLEKKPVESFYPDYKYEGNAWGMTIDLTACIGCNACVVACYSENNIPVVGKEQVYKNREMTWIRIDRYYAGSLDNPQAYFQPLPCMHCEKAPCEPVCPVGATVHSNEGLNDMVYNRCVGTRYCSDNCPYKVRRFNFLRFNDDTTPSLKMMRNPDVTVRSRGVMEKCTYCVQRISHARIDAKKENRPIRDGEIITACQQSCPTGAIVFGDVNDANSQVAKLKAQPLSYVLLAELGTKPRTSYLAQLRNPNPEIPENVKAA